MLHTKMKLITLNIEGDNHYSTVINFLKAQEADVICLQEVFETDLNFIKKSIKMEYATYAPLMIINSNNVVGLSPKGSWGIAIFSKYKPISINRHYYVGSEDNIPVFDNKPNSNNRAIVVVQIKKASYRYTIITTHFTWALSKGTSQLQLKHLNKMQLLLSQYKDYILCGDFNAPRGGKVYAKIAQNLTDHLPADITSTIDPKIHRINGLSLVVDSIFSTPEYLVLKLKIADSISDHKAIVAEITKFDQHQGGDRHE